MDQGKYMNVQLQNEARRYLRTNLILLTDEQQLFFKRMYSHDKLHANILTVVANMSEDKLDWAMVQVKRTIEKNEGK